MRISAATEVDGHARIRDLFVSSIGVLVVECWTPVGRLVGLDGAARALRLLKTGIRGAETNVGGTGNLVDMVRYGAIADNGIDTPNLDYAAAH